MTWKWFNVFQYVRCREFTCQFLGNGFKIETMIPKRLSDTLSILVNKVTNSSSSLVYFRTICTEDFTFLNINFLYASKPCMYQFICQDYHFRLRLSMFTNIKRVSSCDCNSTFTYLLNVIVPMFFFCLFSTSCFNTSTSQHQTISLCSIFFESLISKENTSEIDLLIGYPYRSLFPRISDIRGVSNLFIATQFLFFWDVGSKLLIGK